MIHLKFCRVERVLDGTVVWFNDGAHCWSGNDADKTRRDAAEWVGLGDDLPTYNFEHELAHAFLAEKMWDAVSPVLWNSAHQRKGNITASRFEERWCYHWQRYLRVSPVNVIEDEWPVWLKEWQELLDAR